MDSAEIPTAAQLDATAPALVPALTVAPAVAPATPSSALLQNPTMDLSSFTTFDESHEGDTTLTGEMTASLKKILGAKPTVRQAVEMDHILLLIISKTRALGTLDDPATIDKDTWVDQIMELAGADSGLRMLTSVKVATMFQNAPWSLKQQEDASSREFVRSINAIGAGVEQFTRALGAELEKMAEGGVNLAEYEAPECRWDEESDNEELRESIEEESEEESKELEVPPRKDNIKGKKSTAPKKKNKGKAVVATGSGIVGTTGHGNHKHGSTVPWTNAEHIGLLEAYEANPNRKLVSHAAMADMHNARFWNGLEVRTPPSVAQQFLKMTGRDYGQITGKIAQMRADIAAGNP